MFEAGGERNCETARRFRVGPAKCTSARFSQPERVQGFDLLHGRNDLIDHWHGNSIGDPLGQSRQRRAGQNEDVGFILLHGALREFNQKVFLLGSHLGDLTERAIEHADALHIVPRAHVRERIPRTRDRAPVRTSPGQTGVPPCMP